ncbi:hypothetical protein M011DRAFT_413421, partial [Sporormia fimetaria CBS 119925]
MFKLLKNKDVSQAVARELQETFLHEQSYTDGIIFHKICLFRRESDRESERRWWARLTMTKQKDLKQLMKSTSLMEAFDRLTPFPGLWTPIQLGTLHRLHGLKCPEELCYYLEHVYTVWSGLIPRELRRHVDANTVQKLELLAPGISTTDAGTVSQLMQKQGALFPAITDVESRDLIAERVLKTRCIIPSLRTFFENQKYLEPCCSILRALVGDELKKKSLWNAFSANFFQPDPFMIQYSEQSYSALNLPPKIQLELGYIQLWLFCLRHFPQI